MIKILYNIIEGLVSVFFGFSDESLALFGSGVDSFAEVISGLGIWQMVRRMRRNDGEATDTCELRKFELLSFSWHNICSNFLRNNRQYEVAFSGR